MKVHLLILIICSANDDLLPNSNQDGKSNIEKRSIAVGAAASGVASMFTPAAVKVTGGVLRAIVAALKIIRIATNDNGHSSTEEMLLGQTEALHDGLSGIGTTIGELMKDLIDSLSESRYKEMMLLVDFYTSFVLTEGDYFVAEMRIKRQLLRKSMKRWDELDSAQKIIQN